MNRYLITCDKDFKALVFADNDKEAKEKFKEYLNQTDDLFENELWELSKVINIFNITNENIHLLANYELKGVAISSIILKNGDTAVEEYLRVTEILKSESKS